MKRFALIDLGTNSARLFVYDTNGEKPPKKKFQTKEMVRLGDNLFLTGQLDPNAYRRTVKAFKRFRKIIEDYKPDSVVAIGTSAMRSAEDAERLRNSIFKKTGIALQVISGQEEAELIAEGLLEQLPNTSDTALYIDIGGGSTEVSLAQFRALSGSCSLDIGAARCQQMYLQTVPPDPERSGELQMRKAIRRLLGLQPAFREKYECEFAVGTSGSIRALGRLCRGTNDRDNTFSLVELRHLIERMRPMSREELLELPSLEPKRVDLILSAGIILEEICNFFLTKRIEAVNYSLKDGLIHRVSSGREVGRQRELFPSSS